MQTHTGSIVTAPLYPVHTYIYIKVLWGVLSLANSPTPILHSYLFTPYPANGCYAPLHLLHVLDTCIAISCEKSCSREGLLFMLLHTTRITTLIYSCYLKSETSLPLRDYKLGCLLAQELPN